MKKKLFPLLIATVVAAACKKSGNANNGGSGSNASVTFTNNQAYDQRLIITGTGSADTVYPFPNKVIDIDVKARTAVTRTDVPTGKRKIYTAIVCTAGQPVNMACTTIVYRNIMYVAGQSYTEVLQ
jgi:hypothetical protein